MDNGYVIDLSKAAKEMSKAEYSALFHRLERMRSDARHNEAAALGNARREERAKWQGIVAEKDAVLADKDAVLADKDAVLAEKDAEIERLRAQLGHNRD